MSKKKLPDTLCPQPFLYVYPNHIGSWKPCCKTRDWPFKIMDFDEYWYEDQDLHDLRMSLITGEHSDIWEKTCKSCIEAERSGAKSYRNYSLESAERSPETSEGLLNMIEGFMATDQVLADRRIFKIKVRGLGNECNLKCYMCNPHFSTSRVTEMSKMSNESVKEFYQNVEIDDPQEILVHSKTIPKNKDRTKKQLLDVIDSFRSQISQVNLAGGEPVMIRDYYDLLDDLIESGDSQEINVSIDTNCTKTGVGNRDMLDYIPKFKHFSVSASVDDLYERDNFIRYPSNFETVINTIKKYQAMPKCKIDVNITWSLLNIANARNILEFFRKNDINVKQNINIVYTPIILSPSNHPKRDAIIDDYLGSGDDYLINLAKMMASKKYDQDEFERAIKYIKELDQVRKTNSAEVFGDLKEYLESVRT